MDHIVSLESYEPELQHYLLKHRYPAAIEALLTGLAVMQPLDPWQFIRDKLLQLIQEGPHAAIHWDMFVDENLRPQMMKRGMLDSLLDESDQPTQEIFEKIFHFRTIKLLRAHFNAWQIFYKQEKKENEAFQQRLVQAKTYHTLNVERLVFHSWRSYTAHKNKCRRASQAKLQNVCDQFVLKLLFYAWLEDYKESRKARRWFSRETGPDGSGNDSDEEWYWTEGEDPISLLPREVAVKIFILIGMQAVCRSACVCRSWKEITEDPKLWNTADFSPVGHFVKDEVIVKICQKYRPLLCHLNLRGCTELSSDSLKAISNCQNLQDLNLSESKGINEEVMLQVGKGCAGLLYLNLSYCYITDSIIRILTKHFENLHYLSLAYSPHFTSKGLHSITSGKGCRRLVYLDLSGCTQLSAEGMGFIGRGCSILSTLLLDDIPECSDGMILKLVAQCHTLRHFSLMGASKLTDKAFKHLAMENRRLRSIKIENNSVLTDVTLRAIGKGCRELNHLYIAGCSRVTDQGLRALASLKKLQVLNIADCVRVSDAGVRYVIENSPGAQLRELNLTNLTKIGDVTLLRISQHCKSLTCLSFCYCENISDTGVELLGHIPSLSSLDLSGCSLQDEGIKGLRNNPQFRYLMLAELLDITDDGLQRMCSNLPHLDTLDLSDCEQISDGGMEQVAFYCRMLRVLYIANCHRVTDAGAKCVAKGCPYLSWLDMSGCSVTDRSLSLLRKFSTHLKKLDILCCKDVTREAVLKLKRVEVNYNTDQPKLFHQMSDLANMPVEPLIDRI